jgi:hypothetical protein
MYFITQLSQIKVFSGNTRNEDLASLGVPVPQFEKFHHKEDFVHENGNTTVKYCYQRLTN